MASSSPSPASFPLPPSPSYSSSHSLNNSPSHFSLPLPSSHPQALIQSTLVPLLPPPHSTSTLHPLPPLSPPELDHPGELYIPGLTSPTLFERLPQWIGCQALVDKYLPSHVQEPLLPSTCSAQQLADKYSWRALAEVSRETIVRSEPSDTQAIFKLWTYRLDALLHLRLPLLLHRELSSLFHTISQTFSLPALLLNPSSPLGKPLPDVVPFSILLLRARVPVLLRPSSQRALLKSADMLYELRDACRRMAASQTTQRTKDIWISRTRAVTSRLGALFSGHDGQRLRMSDPMIGGRGLVEQDTELACSLLGELPSAAVPLWIEQGDLGRADKMLTEIDPHSINSSLVALRKVADGDWLAAADAWQTALTEVKTSVERVVVCNNLAVALLYSGKLHLALKTLTPLVLNHKKNEDEDEDSGPPVDPDPEVWEAVVFNLSTLFELSSGESDLVKVEVLKKFIGQIGEGSGSGGIGGGDGGEEVKGKWMRKIEGLDGIRWEAFKLPV